MLEVKLFGDEFVLGADVIVKGDKGKWMRIGGIRWGSRLTIAEEGGNNYEKL